MSILVTGGAGFIGSTIVDKLINNESYDFAEGITAENIVVVDDLSRGSKDNLPEGVRVYKVDINSSELEEVFKENDIRYVFHQAAQADVGKAIRDPLFDAETNIKGTLRLLENCREYRVKKVVYASSAAVYGKPVELPVTEEHPVAPESPYGASKQTPEHYLNIYHQLHGLDYAALRYANVYGPRQFAEGEGGVIAIFINKLLAGEIPVIYGDGKQTRDFVYSGDIAAANLAAMASYENGIFNVSRCEQTSLLDLVAVLRDVFGDDFEVEFNNPRPGDIKDSYLDNSKARAELGWEPEMSLEEGLKKTVEYYEN